MHFNAIWSFIGLLLYLVGCNHKGGHINFNKFIQLKLLLNFEATLRLVERYQQSSSS
jgi:hypothetical protein